MESFNERQKPQCREWHAEMFENLASIYERWDSIKCPYCGELIWQEIEKKPIIHFAPFLLVFEDICVIF